MKFATLRCKFEDDIIVEVEKQKEQLKNSSKKAVLYVEGKTDIIHIQKAWKVLYDNKEIPFDIFTLNGADNIKQFLISYSKEQISKIVIGLVDYDEKGMSVINGLNKNFEYIFKDVYRRKKENNVEKNAYIITLPTPSDNFSKYEYCPIEFLYNKDLLEKYGMIGKRNLNKLNIIYSKVNNDFLNREQLKEKNDLWFYEVIEDNLSKNDFANKVVEDVNLDKEDFQNFKPLFDAINNILSDVDEKNSMEDDM